MRRPGRGRGRQQMPTHTGAPLQSTPIGSGGASAAATAAAATAVKMMPRLAPPPMSLIEMAGWTAVSLAAYLCFLILPGRLGQRKIHRKLNPLVAQDDLAYAGNHLHFGLWSWPLFDCIYRFLCLCVLPRWELIKMSFFATISARVGSVGSGEKEAEKKPVTPPADQSSTPATTASEVDDSSPHGEGVQVEYNKAAEKHHAVVAYNKLHDERLISFFTPIRGWLGSDSLSEGPRDKSSFYHARHTANQLQDAASGVVTGGQSRELGASFLSISGGSMDSIIHNHKLVVLSTFLLTMTVVLLVLYRTHIRFVLAARRQIKTLRLPPPPPYPSNPSDLPDVFSSEPKRREFEAHHVLFNQAEASLFPTVFAVCFWCICYATMFAAVRGMSLLMSQLYPTGVGMLVLYLIFLPG